MLNTEKKVTIELTKENREKNIEVKGMTNPLSQNHPSSDKLSLMIREILEQEIPRLKNNSLLYDLVLYSLIEKMKTVQTVGNVLSYIKENNVKTVNDVFIEDGEIRIKCSG